MTLDEFLKRQREQAERCLGRANCPECTEDLRLLAIIEAQREELEKASDALRDLENNGVCTYYAVVKLTGFGGNAAIAERFSRGEI